MNTSIKIFSHVLSRYGTPRFGLLPTFCAAAASVTTSTRLEGNILKRMPCCFTMNTMDLFSTNKAVGTFNMISQDRELTDSDRKLFDTMQNILYKQHMVSFLDSFCCCCSMKNIATEALQYENQGVKMSISSCGKINAFEIPAHGEPIPPVTEVLNEKKGVNMVPWRPKPCCPCEVSCVCCLPLCCPPELPFYTVVLSPDEIEDYKALSSELDKQNTCLLCVSQTCSSIPYIGCLLALPIFFVMSIVNERTYKNFQTAKSNSIRHCFEYQQCHTVTNFIYYPKSYPSRTYKARGRGERVVGA